MDKITVGQIIKAFGIKGEVKVKPITDDINRFKKLKLVYIGETPYKIIACRIAEGFVYLSFIGVSDRNTSETLVGKMLEIDRVNAVDLEEGRYFISDMIGCKVVLSDGSNVGVITDVAQYGAADVITVKDGDKVCRFPFIKKLSSNFDIENKIMNADAKVFNEVCVYED
ncbi:MAG: 16S rRNA processing protein RimM [Clostridiales bacterium]|nr:16S rRNA processing protein RimM [Clostridiales bacterium]